jgi:hypothetical protein
MAHTLQLSIKQGLKFCNIDGLLSKCRKIVGHFKRSTSHKALLMKEMEKNGAKSESLVSKEMFLCAIYLCVS